MEKKSQTHCWRKTSLYALDTFMLPGLAEAIEHILIHLLTASLDQLTLQLHAGLHDFRRIGESDL